MYISMHIFYIEIGTRKAVNSNDYLCLKLCSCKFFHSKTGMGRNSLFVIPSKLKSFYSSNNKCPYKNFVPVLAINFKLVGNSYCSRRCSVRLIYIIRCGSPSAVIPARHQKVRALILSQIRLKC